MQPLVSIIIPTYNRAHIIGETLDSIIAQTYHNWECIIVDDGSTDDTDEVISKYITKDARIKYYHRSKKYSSGGNGARNYGFKISNGEYIQWFDSDDLMLPENLSLKIKAILSCNANVVFSPYAHLLNDGTVIEVKKSFFKNEKDLFKAVICKKIKINTPSAMWKKIFLLNKDLFDEEVKKGQELDFYSRIFFSNNNIKHITVNTAQILIRTQEIGILNDFNRMESVEPVKSFLKVRRRIHEMVLRRNDKTLYKCSVKFYIEIIRKLVRNKRYDLAFTEIKFLLNKKVISHILRYKYLYIKIYISISILKFTKGKGYFFLKKIKFI